MQGSQSSPGASVRLMYLDLNLRYVILNYLYPSRCLKYQIIDLTRSYKDHIHENLKYNLSSNP